MEISPVGPVSIVVLFFVYLTSVVLLSGTIALALASVVRLTSLDVTASKSSDKISIEDLPPYAPLHCSSVPLVQHRPKWRQQVPKGLELKTS
ncbi:hypothetical protein HBH86_179800 [Parastagonospora nodorum]|nr:hypothetical protein HBH86_179800 [Parastagonospora nodorum]KAH6171629.1 hypothetical protein HBI61_180510 [Parastagonospora nodorum]